MKYKNTICLLLTLAIWLAPCAPFGAPGNFHIAAQTVAEPTKGLRFKLGEAAFQAKTAAVSQTALTAELSESETNLILARLPAIKAEIEDRSDFKLRPNSLLPPKIANVIQTKFPAAETLRPPNIAETFAPALEVVRFSPAGEVPLAADLTVTFSQPMIAVTTQEQAAETVPVRLSPAVAGKWRWLGTQTLIFDAEPRFPMATEFTAIIPAGTKSIAGAVLPEEVAWRFSTAPARTEQFLPNNQEPASRASLLLADFNQEIDAQNVLPKISATVRAEKIRLRLATDAEIARAESVSKTAVNFEPKRRIWFRAVDSLPPDSEIKIVFESGLPSAEGALRTVAPQSFEFKTAGELAFSKSYCGYGETKNECESYQEWQIEFNNPLDAKSFDKSHIRIVPKIEDARISVDDNRISIEGFKKTRTDYKVIVSEKLKDRFGQTLGKSFSTGFKTKSEEPALYHEGQNKDFIILDPNATPIFSVYSTNYDNLKVKLYAVEPEDYVLFRDFEAKAVLPNFGKLVWDKQIKIQSAPDEQTETRINLAPALKGDFGHAILIVEPPIINKENERIVAWLSATQIGVDAFADYEQLTVFASDLKTGKPFGDAVVSLLGDVSAATGEDGIAELKLPANSRETSGLLIVKRGADTAILPESDDYDSDETGWTRRAQKDGLRWFVFDDRKLYRPNEKVSIKGYIRKIAGGKLVDIAELGDAATDLSYVLKDSRDNEILKGSAAINRFGAFDFQLKLPENTNLGGQNLKLTTNGNLENREFTHNFQAEEFRRPEFEVSAETETVAPVFTGEKAVVGVAAKYFAGGALQGAETNWNVTATPANYQPPNHDDFTFGKYVPWQSAHYSSDYAERSVEQFKGAIDRSGKHRLEIDFVSANPARPYKVNAAARVSDVNRQTFVAEAEFLVHPASLYIGIRARKNFVAKGESFKIETITTDIDGNRIVGAPVVIVAEQTDWQQIAGEWKDVVVDTQKCRIESQKNVAACEFTAEYAGNFTIKATVADERGRLNESELKLWTTRSGDSETAREVEQETAELVADKNEYKPGDAAEILVNSPFFPAEGVLTLRRSGIVETRRFAMNQSSTVLRVPIKEDYLPNIYAQVDLVGATARIAYGDERDAKLPARPAFASGEINLQVSTASRKLNVQIEPAAKSLAPGGSTEINLRVTDSNGNAVASSEIAVVAVDEAVLALTDYKIENPLDVFYTQIDEAVADYHSRENVVLQRLEGLNSGYGFGNGSAGIRGGGGGAASIYLRKNFDALAVFAPSVVTDETGKAVVKITLPDTPTRYRITAVAATKSKQFGVAESNITAKQPLIVRPSAPRFMNFGDKIELPVVVQNQTDNALSVNVVVRATNANLNGASGKKIIVAANDRREIRFPVAADKAGIARFQIAATANNFADAAEINLPVWTPATAEAFATYGTTDANGVIVQPITAPTDVFPDFGGLEITTSSTQLQELTDAFIYLQNYPFECSEQTASRVLSVAALRDVLTAFDAKDLPAKSEIAAKMKLDIERLGKLQHRDGGWSFWRSDDASFPFVSIHVAHALARVKAKGYDVPPEAINKSLQYLKNIETELPTSYSSKAKSALSAYALYARDLLGDKDAAKARKIAAETAPENLSPETTGWLLSVVADDKESAATIEQLKRRLFNSAVETAGAAHFVTDYADGEYVLLSSDKRHDAVVLEALLKVEPTNGLIVKIVRGLLAGKTKGRWANTQENVFVLLALDKYFQVYEKTMPDFVARVWLGQQFAGEQKFAGRVVDSNSISVPMQYLTAQATQNLILEKAGAGRFYYRVGLKYAPRELRLTAADYGFAVTRSYEVIDDASDVRQNQDGSWTIKAGARIRVSLQMVAPTRRYHVALVDRLPAGLEIINAALANAENVLSSDRKSADESRRSGWFEHQNLRDERAEAFQSSLDAGVWTYSYTARATTPGKFIVPPAKAEEMYQPETFGRSNTDFVVIE